MMPRPLRRPVVPAPRPRRTLRRTLTVALLLVGGVALARSERGPVAQIEGLFAGAELPGALLAAVAERAAVGQVDATLTEADPAPSPVVPLPPVPLDEAGQAVWERLFAAELASVAAPAWPAAPAVPPVGVPRLRSSAWYVVDVDTGEVLTAKDGDTPRPIASLTKLASGLIWADSGADPQAALSMTQEDKDFLQVTRSRLRVGASYRAWDLFHSSLLSSDNRATVALARQTGLPMSALTAAMERRAAALGLSTARFGDPTGLDPGDIASPRDVARLLFAADAHPVVGPVLRTVEHRYRRIDRPVWLAARASNRLAHMKHWEVRSGKTGYTDLAGSCVVFRTRIAGRDLIISLLGARGVDSRYGDAARLRTWIEALPPQEPGALPEVAPPSPAPTEPAPSPAVASRPPEVDAK